MNFPYNPIIGGVEISTHTIAEFVAFAVGFRLYVLARKRIQTEDPFTSEQRLIILVAATLGALIFSRLVGALENPNEWMNASNPWVYLFMVKTVAGGFMGGWLFVEITKYFMKVKSSSGDVMVFPIIVALIIGRLGCFSQGVYDMTHGYPTNWITGMDLGDGIARHPLALYEIVVLAAIGLFIYLAQRKRPFKNGWQFKSFMLLYLLYRFFAEYMKPHHSLALGMTSIQLGVIITYLLNIMPFYRLIKNESK